MQVSAATMGNSTEVPQKTKTRTTMWCSSPTPGHIHRKTITWKDTHIPMLIITLFTIAKTWQQPLFVDGWMDKEGVACMYLPCVCGYFVVSDSLWPHGLLQAPLSMEISGQTLGWVTILTSGDLPKLGIEPLLDPWHLQVDSLPLQFGRNFSNLRDAEDTTLRAESKEELESLLMKVIEESERVGLKLNIQKIKSMASGPITSWQIDGETMETVRDFIFWIPKITADGDCSLEIKRQLLLGRKVMTNLDSILKSRDITLPRNFHLFKAVVFPVVMYGCESWTIKKAEHQRIDDFKLVLEKTLESSLDCKEIQPVHPKGNQSWIFIGRTDAEAKTPILWPPDVKNRLIWKAPDAGKVWGQEEKGTTEDEVVGWHHRINVHEFE